MKPATEIAKETGPKGSVFGLLPTFKRLSKSKSAFFGLLVVLVLFVTAGLASFISPHDKAMQYRSAVKVPPMTRIPWEEINAEFEGVPEGQFHPARSNLFILGTDKFGRDIFSRILYGAQISLIVGVVAEIIAILIGVTIGAMAGYFGGLLDSLLMRVTDTFFAFPPLLLAIGILAVFDRPGLFTVFVALAFRRSPAFQVLVNIDSDNLVGGKKSILDSLAEGICVDGIPKVVDVRNVSRLLWRGGHADLRCGAEIF